MQDLKNIKNDLEELIKQSDNVFIVPHNVVVNVPDFDGIGASIGMSLICRKNKKKNYIVLNDKYENLDFETSKIISNINNEYELIKTNEVSSLMTDNSLLIVVDANKEYLISVKPFLNDFKNIFVLDHHKMDNNTIKTNHLYVDDKMSSTCEVVSNLLFQNAIKLSSDQATLLYAGIILDTDRFQKNATDSTHIVASKLIVKGANPTIANSMFCEDYEHDRAIQRIVDNATFPTYVYAVASDRDDSGRIYNIEDIAKAADYLLKYKVNAAFAIARISDDIISVSARSKGGFDVSRVMKMLGGGGNEFSAAARISGKTINEVREELEYLLNPINTLDAYENSNNDEMKLKLKM